MAVPAGAGQLLAADTLADGAVAFGVDAQPAMAAQSSAPISATRRDALQSSAGEIGVLIIGVGPR
jgi:hypothetical protein